MLNPNEEYFTGSEPSKKTKKEPTGILKELKSLNRYIMFKGIQLKEEDTVVLWSDVEAIINKYLNP